MKVKKKNKFWTFIFSLIPGAAEMYMGLMKMGVSLMVMFMLTLGVSLWLENVVLLFALVVIWFYAFFHARNLASMDEAELQQIDDRFFLWNEGTLEWKNLFVRYKKGIALLLILCGLTALWGELDGWITELIAGLFRVNVSDVWMFVDDIPRMFVAVIIIIVGVRLIIGKKKELTEEDGTD